MQFGSPGIVSSNFSSIFEVPFPPYTILNGIALIAYVVHSQPMCFHQKFRKICRLLPVVHFSLYRKQSINMT